MEMKILLLLHAHARNEGRLKLILLLQRYHQKCNKLPVRKRNRIDNLIETFLEDLVADIHDMICESNAFNYHDDLYRGLDRSRDTEEELETAI